MNKFINVMLHLWQSISTNFEHGVRNIIFVTWELVFYLAQLKLNNYKTLKSNKQTPIYEPCHI